MSYFSTKTYGAEQGLSCCFRQWKASSHCHHLHGYSLSFKFMFGCEYIDDRNWVQDFGSLSELKDQLKLHFDHKTAVAVDDPQLELFMEMERQGLLNLTILDRVGCESFAFTGWNLANDIITREHPDGRVWVESCEVAEHGANSAIYVRELIAQ